MVYMKEKFRIPNGMKPLGVLLLSIFLVWGFSGCATPNRNTVKPQNAVNEQLADKTWLLAGYNTGAFFVPLEPGDGTTAWILFKTDGTLNGTTGINNFIGTWSLKKTEKTGLNSISIIIKGLTKMAAPNKTAAKFEQNLIRQFESSRFLKTGKDSILLLNEQNETLVQCIYRDEGLLF